MSPSYLMLDLVAEESPIIPDLLAGPFSRTLSINIPLKFSSMSALILVPRSKFKAVIPKYEYS